MKQKLLLLVALLVAATTAWADVEINETNFPDANFRAYLTSQTYGSDGVITDAEIAGVTDISVYYRNISDLKGIEYFTALTSLGCGGNQLTALDVSQNSALTNLSCGNNQLTTLDVSMNTVLTSLGCSINQLTTLDVSKNTVLTSLECYTNQLTSLDVSQNSALTSLLCYNNQLSTLDVSKNTALTILLCYCNQIKDDGMDVFVASLPTVTSEVMRVIYNEGEQNVMTTTQVATAKAKGWTPYYYDGSDWLEYAGCEPSSIDIVERSQISADSIWYTLAGRRISGLPAQKGLYITGGKKVIVR